jgi:hypothetical protein
MPSPRTDARVRLEADEEIVGWTRAWYSRAPRTRLLGAFTARYRDIVVVTDRRLMLWEVGMLTRRPRRRVLADRLAEITVEDVSRNGTVRRLRFSKPEHRAMLLDFGRDNTVANELVVRAGRTISPPPSSSAGSTGDETSTGNEAT